MENQENRPPVNCRSCEYRGVNIYQFPCMYCHTTDYKYYVYKKDKNVKKKTSEFQVEEFVFD